MNCSGMVWLDVAVLSVPKGTALLGLSVPVKVRVNFNFNFNLQWGRL